MDELEHEIQPEVKTTQERLDNLAAAARISAEQTELLYANFIISAALDEKIRIILISENTNHETGSMKISIIRCDLSYKTSFT